MSWRLVAFFACIRIHVAVRRPVIAFSVIRLGSMMRRDIRAVLSGVTSDPNMSIVVRHTADAGLSLPAASVLSGFRDRQREDKNNAAEQKGKQLLHKHMSLLDSPCRRYPIRSSLQRLR